MKFFLFAGGVRHLQNRSARTKHGVQHFAETNDSCSHLIVGGEGRGGAEKNFTEWLLSDQKEDIVAQRVDKIVGAPMLNEFLTESGLKPIHWETIDDEVQASRSSEMESDDFEQGFWVDVNQIVPPYFNVDSLLQTLPDDIRSGLNWSSEKKFYFLLSVLSSTASPNATPAFDNPVEMPEDNTDIDLAQLRDGPVDFPELVDRELSVLIEARNAVVAGCLWRKHAASTPLAGHAIRIDSWCGVMTV